MRGSDVVILIALVVLFALMVFSIVMMWYSVVHLYASGGGYVDEMHLLLLWASIAVYVVSYLVPKKIIFKEGISEVFIVFISSLVIVGVSYIIADVLKILFVGPGSKPVENIEIIMSMLLGLMGAFLALFEHREHKKEHEHNIVKVINVD